MPAIFVTIIRAAKPTLLQGILVRGAIGIHGGGSVRTRIRTQRNLSMVLSGALLFGGPLKRRGACP